jgi:hypothetical protein
MIAVIFEVLPHASHVRDYLGSAAQCASTWKAKVQPCRESARWPR